MCGFLVSSVELLVTSERKAVGRDHHNIWVWGNCDLQGRPMRKWNQRLKPLEVVKPLFNISSDKHVSSSQMPVVGGTTKTEVHGFYSCPPGDYSVRKKKPTQVFISFSFHSGFHFIFPWIKIWQRRREVLFPKLFQLYKTCMYHILKSLVNCSNHVRIWEANTSWEKKNKKVIFPKIKLFQIQDPKLKSQMKFLRRKKETSSKY